MPSLDWTKFYSLTGDKRINFENLCRAMIRLHFGRSGQFAALRNQPGVEFHLQLSENSSVLGAPPRWWGWQCKLHTPTSSGNLKSAARRDIEDSLKKTEKYLPNITDWVLWTPYTLSKKDQAWFNGLPTKFTLHQWTKEEVATYLNGPGLLLRSTHFGELVLTPDELEQRHREAIQPVQKRWLEPVHQSVDTERTIRRMLGEPDSWEHLVDVGKRLQKAKNIFSKIQNGRLPQLRKTMKPFISACTAFADTLLNFHTILAKGDLDLVQQKLTERKTLIDTNIFASLRRLRSWNSPIALYATNALADMQMAQDLLDEAEELLDIGLVAVLADAGAGKTQMAAQLTASQKTRPAGILFHGQCLHRGQSLNDLSRNFTINGTPVDSMERLLAMLDAAAKRSNCRLPIVIDGLSEAENPKDWKASLATLREIIKKYPNVLVICTLRTGEHSRRGQEWIASHKQTETRELFADMAIPEGMKKLESEGFGGDVGDAVEKYFDYFKINAENAEIPLEFLQHPLTLRIYCEVINSKRESEVIVDCFPASLVPLFEKYVANVCERISQMTNLSYSFRVDEVDFAIYKLGLLLWQEKQREIDEEAYRKTVSDINRSWDSSIVNLLAQEGIIFKNPSSEPGKFVLTPVYDALGGYIIANALLTSNMTDRTLTWFNSPGVLASFGGDDSHELASDIFRSLVALIPKRINGFHLWQVVPDSFRDVALMFSIGLEAEFLDNDTVSAIMDLMRENTELRPRLFLRFQKIRSTVNHPLNVEILDVFLRDMSVSERDLSWTEWIRKSRTERFNDILAIELRWKENLITRTSSDQLRAKWLMWLLTSTDHELRDVATRALYWFGRGCPDVIFEESLKSVNINDPYIPERMLAACYGVAMACHVGLESSTFTESILPGYAKELYKSFFAEEALWNNTHMLLREYAARIIELALLYNSTLLSAREIERSKPPFTNGLLDCWQESKTSLGKRCGLNSPFHMDFENYTLGRLIPERRNYDFEHEGYKKIRSQILWRIEQFGWSSKLFENVDNSIANAVNWSRSSEDATRVDRYGKKYSWIAYFEMAGALSDQGVGENWRERTYSVDIDPSFPGQVAKGKVIEEDFLGDSDMIIEEWIVNGPVPAIEPYLQLGIVSQEKGPWVMLDGYVTQENENYGRSLFCFIRSFMVTKQETDYFLKYLRQQDLGGRWLPEKPEVIYTFAGEIPWCNTFPDSDTCDFSFVTGKRTEKILKKQKVVYLDGIKTKFTEIDLAKLRIFGDVSEEIGGQQCITKDDLERIEVREEMVEVEEVVVENKKFEVQIPVCDFGWEGYQTVASNAGRATCLAAEISASLKLVGKPQTFDLFTENGIRATFNISDQSGYFKNTQSMFFIKEHLLKTYLEKNNLDLIWAVWGEREYSSKQAEKLFYGSDRPEHVNCVYSIVKKY